MILSISYQFPRWLALLLICVAQGIACSSVPSSYDLIDLSSPAYQAALPAGCDEFRQLVEKTYNFSPSKLTAAEQNVKSAEMDTFWEKVKSNKNFLPCLVSALKNQNANKFFLFDGGTLLFSLDKSEDAKKLLIESISKTDFKDIDLQYWIVYPLKFGFEGLDTSLTGEAWLRATKPVYYLPQHGGLPVDKLIGALAIYGSMDESFATPALLKIANQQDHPGREIAVRLLLKQLTPDAINALKDLNRDGLALAPDAKKEIDSFLANPTFIEPRAGQPKVTRDQYLSSFQKLANGDANEFMTLVGEVSDGEKDAVAVLRTEDVPLVRKARRFFASTGTPHVPDWYQSFTDILVYLIRKPEIKKTKAV